MGLTFPGRLSSITAAHSVSFPRRMYTMRHGLLEPYSLFGSLFIAFPSIILGFYVYFRIWRSTEFGKSQYLRLYTFKSLNELVLYLFNLTFLRLPVQRFMHSFYKGIADSILISIGGLFFSVSILAPFSYGIILSLNRFYVISRMEFFTKKGLRYFLGSLVLIYAIPVVLSTRFLVWKAKLSELEGDGPGFFLYTPPAPKIYECLVFGFYVTSIVTEAMLNLATLYSLCRNEHSKSSPLKRQAEIGLFITTFFNFLLNSFYVAVQFIIYFFPLAPSTLADVSSAGYVIVIDLICIAPIYLLIAFSSRLRSQIFSSPFVGTDSSVVSLSSNSDGVQRR